jgi:hypothetical protein
MTKGRAQFGISSQDCCSPRNEGKAEESRILLLKLYEQNANDAEH